MTIHGKEPIKLLYLKSQSKEPIPRFTGINDSHWAQQGYRRTNKKMNFPVIFPPGEFRSFIGQEQMQLSIYVHKYSFLCLLLICNENISTQSSFILHSTKINIFAETVSKQWTVTIQQWKRVIHMKFIKIGLFIMTSCDVITSICVICNVLTTVGLHITLCQGDALKYILCWIFIRFSTFPFKPKFFTNLWPPMGL